MRRFSIGNHLTIPHKDQLTKEVTSALFAAGTDSPETHALDVESERRWRNIVGSQMLIYLDLGVAFHRDGRS
jgi:hypothetical protein